MKNTVVGLSLVLLTLATSAVAKPPGPPPPPPVPTPAYDLRMLENEFLAGGFSNCKKINNLGDVIGLAQIPGPASPINGTFPRTTYVSTPEGRANGIDMVSLPALFQAHLTPAEQLTWQQAGFSDINDARQIVGRGAYFVDGVFSEWRVIVAQLEVALDGMHSITGFVDLGNNGTTVAINNDGDILVTPLRIFRAGFGWGATIPNTTGPYALSNRSAGSAYIVANLSTAERGLRLTYDVASDAVTSTVTLQGPYSKDRSNQAVGVNESGEVAGEMATGRSDWRAFLYTGGVMKNLGNLTSASSWNDSYGHAVNAHGNVVGGSFQGDVPGNSGLLYVKATNTTYDSAATLSVDDRAIYTSLVSRDSAGINNSGIICGPAVAQPVMNETLERAYLLLPVP